MKKKHVVVLFSGGLDSTYLVWKNLIDGNTVTPFYIEIENNRNKSILEKNRIILLQKEFRKEFGYNIDDVQFGLKLHVNLNDNLFLRQVPIWLLGALFSQSANEIQIGYVSNDDAIPYLDDIKKIYNEYSRISEKLVPLKFPITKMSKFEMMKQLPHQYAQLIVSCENPEIIGRKTDAFVKYKPCCDCVPCKNIISSNYYYTYNFPEIYKEKMDEIKIREVKRLGYKVTKYDGSDVLKDEFPISNIKGVQLTLDFDYTQNYEYEKDCEMKQVNSILYGS